MDRSCVPVGDRLYVIGGQEGDFQAKPGSPIYKCSRRREVTLPALNYPDSKVLTYASTRNVLEAFGDDIIYLFFDSGALQRCIHVG